MHKLFYIPFCAVLIAMTGCKDDGLSNDEKEERDPLVKTGLAYMEQSQWAEAERTFKEALENSPGMAKPHLDLAIIYQQYNPNYIHAIYHYDRYLELRPDSEKAEFIREQRDKVRRALDVQAIQNSPEWKQVAAEVIQLRKENAALKQQLSASSSAQTAPASSAPVQAATSSSTAKATADTGSSGAQHQIYTVVAGDTLTKIAAKFYGDGESWEPIYEANKNSLSSPSSLRVGQTLVIPAKKN